ncbi:MAG: hypothetical protein SH848_02225 [Saprospiraceae bacterium]|nr:hypothetical protein [Saprospiraceae bacterium]MDZ4702715.1 hypothetical protein [Saprospiraceae bacterium]
MKRIVFPLIITGFLGLLAISCKQDAQNGQTQTQENPAIVNQDSAVASGYTSIPESDGKKPPVKQLKAEEMRVVSMDGKDLEVTTMYAGDHPKQVYCKTIGREDEARYYFNSEGKVSQLDEISKNMSGEYVQEIFIYVGDSLQVAITRKAATKAGLEKAKAENFKPLPNDARANADKVSKKGFVLLVSKD